MTIGIVGTRQRNGQKALDAIEKALLPLLGRHNVHYRGIEIVSGGCPEGGDRFAELLARRYQLPIKIYYAPWDSMGKGAGYFRNADIARDADILIACVAPDRTGGTEDTIKKFKAKYKFATEGGKLILV